MRAEAQAGTAAGVLASPWTPCPELEQRFHRVLPHFPSLPLCPVLQHPILFFVSTIRRISCLAGLDIPYFSATYGRRALPGAKVAIRLDCKLADQKCRLSEEQVVMGVAKHSTRSASMAVALDCRPVVATLSMSSANQARERGLPGRRNRSSIACCARRWRRVSGRRSG